MFRELHLKAIRELDHFKLIILIIIFFFSRIGLKVFHCLEYSDIQYKTKSVYVCSGNCNSTVIDHV